MTCWYLLKMFIISVFFTTKKNKKIMANIKLEYASYVYIFLMQLIKIKGSVYAMYFTIVA